MKRPKIEWLTAGEVWHRYRFSRQALYNMRKAGQVRCKKAGHVYLYSAASIEKYFMGRDERKAKVPKPD